MKKFLLSIAVVLLSAIPAVADGVPDELPPLPSETGEEICTGKLTLCEAGLASCGADREVWQALANECLGLPSGTSLADARKKRVEKPKVAKKKHVRHRKVVRKRRKVRRVRKSAPKPARGPQGLAGKDGRDGADGHSIVWSLHRLKPGKTCLAGGYLMLLGVDADDDGFLDPTEATDLMATCHGRAGKDGRDGRNGDDGVRPTLGTGVFASALYAYERPDSYAVFATASLGWPLNDSVSLTLTGGVAPGLDAAMMLGVGLDWRLGESSGVRTGVIYEVVGLTDNAYANDQFALVDVGAYRDINLYDGESAKLNLRGELSGLIGVDGFVNADRKTRGAYGVGGSLGLRLEF